MRIEIRPGVSDVVPSLLHYAPIYQTKKKIASLCMALISERCGGYFVLSVVMHLNPQLKKHNVNAN